MQWHGFLTFTVSIHCQTFKRLFRFFFQFSRSEHRKAFEKVLPISKPSKVQILGVIVIVSQDKKWWRERANQSRNESHKRLCKSTDSGVERGEIYRREKLWSNKNGSSLISWL